MREQTVVLTSAQKKRTQLQKATHRQDTGKDCSTAGGFYLYISFSSCSVTSYTGSELK